MRQTLEREVKMKLQALEKMRRLHNWALSLKLHRDKTFLLSPDCSRETISELCSLIIAGKVSAVVCWKLSNLGGQEEKSRLVA